MRAANEVGQKLSKATKDYNAALQIGSEPYEGLYSDIWPCYRDVVAADDYYLTPLELVLIAHVAERNVAIFVESDDSYVIDQYVSGYSNKAVGIVLERDE